MGVSGSQVSVDPLSPILLFPQDPLLPSTSILLNIGRLATRDPLHSCSSLISGGMPTFLPTATWTPAHTCKSSSLFLP